jgi:hypothetical protein
MSKKWKIILAAVATVVVLTVGGGAIVMADDETATASNPLLARVAEILEKDEAEVVDAFKAARIEVAREAITAALDKAVTNDVITATDKLDIEAWLAQQPDPTDKDAMKAWWTARPEITKPALYWRFLGARRSILRYGWCHNFAGIAESQLIAKVAAKLGVGEQALVDAFNTARQEMRTSAFQKALANAVTNGRLNQAEATQIETWWSQRPAAVDKFAPGFGFGQMGRGCCEPRLFRNR